MMMTPTLSPTATSASSPNRANEITPSHHHHHHHLHLHAAAAAAKRRGAYAARTNAMPPTTAESQQQPPKVILLTAHELKTSQSLIPIENTDTVSWSGWTSTHEAHSVALGDDERAQFDAWSASLEDASFWERADRYGNWGGDAAVERGAKWADRAGMSPQAPTTRSAIAASPTPAALMPTTAVHGANGGQWNALTPSLPLFMWCAAGGAVAGALSAWLPNAAATAASLPPPSILDKLVQMLLNARPPPIPEFLRQWNRRSGRPTTVTPLWSRRKAYEAAARRKFASSSDEMQGVLRDGTAVRRPRRGDEEYEGRWPSWFGKPPPDYKLRQPVSAESPSDTSVPTVAALRKQALREEVANLRRSGAMKPNAKSTFGPHVSRREQLHARDLANELEMERARTAQMDNERQRLSTQVRNLMIRGVEFQKDIDSREELIDVLNKRVEETEQRIEALASMVTDVEEKSTTASAAAADEEEDKLSLPPVDRLVQHAETEKLLHSAHAEPSSSSREGVLHHKNGAEDRDGPFGSALIRRLSAWAVDDVDQRERRTVNVATARNNNNNSSSSNNNSNRASQKFR